MKSLLMVLSAFLYVLGLTGCGGGETKTVAEQRQIVANDLLGGKKSLGETVFKANCAECHGVDAKGVSAPNIRGIDPAIFAGVVNDPPSAMLSRKKTLQKSYQDLYAYLSSLPAQ